jgi:hypothetical protein
MAFRNSVKVTLLLEPEQPRLRYDEPAPLSEALAPTAKPAPLAPRALENAAQRAADKESAAAAWHARAEEIIAMADMLPAMTTRPLMPKIADLYNALARDAGWTAPDALPPDDSGLEEAPQANAAEEPPAVAPPADPRPAERIALPRRPLPLGRRLPRRRA